MHRSCLLWGLLLVGCSASSVPHASGSLPRVELATGRLQLEPGWITLPSRPPVPAPSQAGEGAPPSSDALGEVWEEDEENEWRGTWIRRGKSTLFDAYWVHPTGERVLAVVEVHVRGQQVEVLRRHADGQGCTYSGTINDNRVDVSGWYSCSWHRHTSPWRAQIVRMQDVSPRILSEGGWRRSQ